MTHSTSAQIAEIMPTIKTENVQNIVKTTNLHAELNSPSKSLKECAWLAIKNYYTHVQGGTAADVYQMVLAQIEPPVLKATLEFARGNQSKAAIILGLSRGTLRKKLKEYGLD
jgi:Fis family transcriptional regulator